MIVRIGMICVYAHCLPGESRPFYVGMGVLPRPFEASGRNRCWNGIVRSAGRFNVTILGWFHNSQDAHVRELAEIQSRQPIANLNGSCGCGECLKCCWRAYQRARRKKLSAALPATQRAKR